MGHGAPDHCLLNEENFKTSSVLIDRDGGLSGTQGDGNGGFLEHVG